MYFVHSFYVKETDQSLRLSGTEYGLPYTSSIITESIVATQFHPEKSGKVGLEFLKKVLEYFKC